MASARPDSFPMSFRWRVAHRCSFGRIPLPASAALLMSDPAASEKYKARVYISGRFGALTGRNEQDTTPFDPRKTDRHHHDHQHRGGAPGPPRLHGDGPSRFPAA